MATEGYVEVLMSDRAGMCGRAQATAQWQVPELFEIFRELHARARAPETPQSVEELLVRVETDSGVSYPGIERASRHQELHLSTRSPLRVR